MKIINSKILTIFLFVFVMLFMAPAFSAEDAPSANGPSGSNNFPDRMMLRLGFYNLSDTNTDMSVNSTGTGVLGTTINYEKDLGGEDSASTPRIDAYYRFNDKHRIEFGWFEVDRGGFRKLDIDFTYEGSSYSINDTVKSNFKSRTIKLAYGYSFYHSKEAEISFTTGLHFIDYDISLTDSANNKNNEADVAAPLPVFGMHINYNISDRWMFKYSSQTFYINLNDTIRGSLLDLELDLEYRFTKHFAAGLGLTRLSIDADIEDSDFKGSMTDLYRGYLLYVAAYL